MRYLNNPTGKDVEFLCGGKVYIVPAGKTVGLEDEVVQYYAGYVNGPLKEVSGELMVRIANNNDQGVTYNGVIIKAKSEIELPKPDAKAFIRAVKGVFWAEVGKKKSSETIVESSAVGERGDV